MQPRFFIFFLRELEVARPDRQQGPADVWSEVGERELQKSLTGRGEKCEVRLERQQPGEDPLVLVSDGEVERCEASSVGEVEAGQNRVLW